MYITLLLIQDYKVQKKKNIPYYNAAQQKYPIRFYLVQILLVLLLLNIAMLIIAEEFRNKCLTSALWIKNRCNIL